LVTHSGGFIHSSVGFAEKTLKEIGPKHGLEVTCYRFTQDPDAKVKGKNGETTALEAYSERFRGSTGLTVSKENCGRINRETLKNFDVVLFFTTGDPLTKDELGDLIEWVKAGGGYAGTHCASDTLYGSPVYGELVGGYFDGHPWHQKIKLINEDPNSPLTKTFPTASEITDEIYQFRGVPYSREKLRILLKVDNSSINAKAGKRKDSDYAVSWIQNVGKGHSFYTSLGHREDVWKDPRFQEHLLTGIQWSAGKLKADATPSDAVK